MVNMNYCGFNNTKLALNECLEAIQSGEELSEEEMTSCRGDLGSLLISVMILESLKMTMMKLTKD